MSKYEHGLVTYVDNATGSVTGEVPMTNCCHCGLPFPLPRPYRDKSPMAVESRKGRGYCQNCGGHVCGLSCSECVHWERMLARIEGTESLTAVSVNVPREILLPRKEPVKTKKQLILPGL